MSLLMAVFSLVSFTIEARTNNSHQFGSVQFPIATTTIRFKINNPTQSVPDTISNDSNCTNNTKHELNYASKEIQRSNKQELYPTLTPTPVLLKSNFTQDVISEITPRNSVQQYPTNVPSVQSSNDPTNAPSTSGPYPTNVPSVNPRKTLNSTVYPTLRPSFMNAVVTNNTNN